MHDTITGPVFQEMLIFGAASIAKEKQSINDLNVFPVPDGDTGTNMSLTMHAAAQELQKRSPATVDLASSITASALLRGARGNSGVILSLLFRGMSKSLKGCVTADGCTFAAAMQEGVSAAYNAVMKPAEGTILTVSRLAADRAMAASAEKNSVEYVIEQAIAQGEETLRQTVDMNPVLKKAGVVDAGGKGFLVILKGMLAALRGETMPTLETEHAARDKADFASVGDEDITFAFDTVFIVRRIDDRSIEPFREFLNGIGDSLVIGEDDEAFKVHVHTDTPGVALTEAQRYGTLELAKIENMRTQAEDLAAGRKAQSTDDLEEDGHDHAAPAPQPQELKPFGFLAVCAGDGLAAVFADLGADGIVNGGQTMNPSTADILDAVDKVNAKTIFVLPNNKNIILAANQAAELMTDKELLVIPTKTIPQGITAVINFVPELSVEENEETMLREIKNVKTGQVTYAVRDTEIDGMQIRQNDYMGIGDKAILAVGTDLKETTMKMIDAMVDEDSAIVSIYYGADETEEHAQEIGKMIEEKYPDVEVEINCGGQPIYYFVISVE